MGSSPFARTERGRGNSHGLFQCELRASRLSFPSVTIVTSPQGEYTSPTFRRSHALRTAESFLDHLFQCELGPTGFVPLCLWRDFSPGRIYVSDVWSLALAQNSRRLPRPLFSVRASGLMASLPSVSGVTSPQGESTSPAFGRSHALRTAEDSLVHFSVRASGLASSFPSVTDVTSPQGEHTSPTFGRSHTLRNCSSLPRPLFARASDVRLMREVVYSRQDAQRILRWLSAI